MAASVKYASRSKGWVRIASALMLLSFCALAIVRPYFYLMDVPHVRMRRVTAILGRLTGRSEAMVPQAALDSAEAIVDREVRRGAFPGAALAVGRGDQALLEVGIGRIGWTRGAGLVDAEA
ncbi:MAG TPA: hypothetical protein VFH27_01440, partial [Longimicrobiaceae bacterium]|nr:hypothetical protein [Longimicrobiaceae bacterium]